MHQRNEGRLRCRPKHGTCKVIGENIYVSYYKGTRKEGQVEKLQSIENVDENSDEINEFDEFDAMAARDWVNALIVSQGNRELLDKFNNQIQTVPTRNCIQMLCGIEMLADLLGVELEKLQHEDGIFKFTYFDYKGKRFIQIH